MMENENVYYINVKPYHFSMPYHEMALKYFEKFSPDFTENDFLSKIETYMNRYKYTVVPKGREEYEVDNIISKQIMRHLGDFFKSKKRHTIKKKHRHSKHRKTKKSKRNK